MPSIIVTLLFKVDVDNFVEHEESMTKLIGNEISLETGVYFTSNVSSEPKLCTDKFVEFIDTLQLNPLNTLRTPSFAGI